ncbi:response regulator transcription factor [Priestia megaterium]|jgi:DNA-binding NarL/FixJ family response regulator|uniref:Response regulator transcription factor n=1 Tax=Priestia megaterium TaxID=1404 RepID=A0A6H1NY95_PRIMG|nr:response regulator transcription factor [Priestia megaterium]QIZ06269.1 response regulator transcription factor [Priestia megaterium]
MRILIVEDHPMFRDGLQKMLETAEEFEVVGEASSGEEAVELAERLKPNIILMDINLPKMSGIEATKRIVPTNPDIGILVLTMYDDDSSVFAAMRAGARGYLLKEANRNEIVRAIQAVSEGEAIFSPAIARRMMFYFEAKMKVTQVDVFPQLTEREREVLDHIAKGKNNAEIANKLGLNQKTVRNHVSNILSKLQASDRAHAIIMAREAGLGKDSQ